MWKSYDPAWAIPLHRYWQHIGFPGNNATMTYRASRRDTTVGITWIELVMDFEMATQVHFLHHSRSATKHPPGAVTNLRDRARYFCCATRQLFRICGGPKLPVVKSGALHAFGGVASAGIPTRPVLCSPEHIFAELAHQALNHKSELNGRGDSSQWPWPPLYFRLPKPAWLSLAIQPPVRPVHRLRRKTAVT